MHFYYFIDLADKIWNQDVNSNILSLKAPGKNSFYLF